MISLELILLASLAVDPLLQGKCIGCHENLIGFDPQEPLKDLATAEKIVRRLRAGTMPPKPMDENERLAFVENLEKRIDEQVGSNVNPGRKPASKLNAAEYEASIYALFGIKIDASDFQLPLFSGYLQAAAEISNKVQVKDLARLVKEAYRGLDRPEDLADAMKFYASGGMKLAVQSILCSPRFLFRFEGVNPDLELASRMSFFLWSGPPDRELRAAPRASQLDRMLKDKRAESLATRFAMQWLRIEKAPMRAETELFLKSMIKQDRSILDWLTAPESFLDPALVKLYGMTPNKTNGFERRIMPPERQGLLGQASILTATSLPDRTSPVLRGKWILEVLLGIPPPPPPPNVPAKESEEHAKNPRCSSCHRIIDPLGMALENYDSTGAWRDGVNARGRMYDGQELDGIAGLRAALLRHQDLFLLSFTEQLMTYALGRRLEAFDMVTVRRVIEQARRQDYKFSAFVKGIIASPAFQAKPQ